MQKFNITPEMHKHLQKLATNVKFEVIDAVCNYLFNNTLPQVCEEAQTFLNNFDSVLRRKKASSINGRKGGAPKGNANARKHKPQFTHSFVETNYLQAPPATVPTEQNLAELETIIAQQAKEIKELKSTLAELQQGNNKTSTSPEQVELAPTSTEEADKEEIYKRLATELAAEIEQWQQHKQRLTGRRDTKKYLLETLYRTSQGNIEKARFNILYAIKGNYKGIFEVSPKQVKKLFRNTDNNYKNVTANSVFQKK